MVKTMQEKDCELKYPMTTDVEEVAEEVEEGEDHLLADETTEMRNQEADHHHRPPIITGTRTDMRAGDLHHQLMTGNTGDQGHHLQEDLLPGTLPEIIPGEETVLLLPDRGPPRGSMRDEPRASMREEPRPYS